MFSFEWTDRAEREFAALEAKATQEFQNRQNKRKSKSTKTEGLFKQITKTLGLLRTNPRHRSLQTHEFHSLDHPFDPSGKVFVAYAQHKTPGAYGVFWCYGRARGEIIIIAITPHP